METRSMKRQRDTVNCETSDEKRTNGTKPVSMCNKKKQKEKNSSLQTAKNNDPKKRKAVRKPLVKRVGKMTQYP